MLTKQHVAALVGEFIGVAVLASVVLAVANSQIGIALFIGLSAGLALVMLVLSLGKISGAHLNPAITIGLWTVRDITTVRAITYLFAQMLGGFAAFALYGYLVGLEEWTNVVPEYSATVLVAEVVGTAIFAFGIAAAIANKLPVGAKAAAIGGSLTIGILVASIASPAFLNPAVAVAAQSLSWTFVLGPILGSIIGFNLYTLLISAATAPIEEVQSKPKAAKSVTKKK